ncbi:MAG TPA: ABC transporter permease subunit [Polyangiaceae bacterium]|nr:ABC transporter permease subunit [Polyangiaceae bacterium]
MRNILIIARRDLRAQFNSPVAYVVLGGTMLLLGVLFFVIPHMAVGGELVGGFWEIDHATLEQMFTYIPPLLSVLVIPAVTMRSLAAEKGTGTLELLITMPVRDSEVILGKYLAACIMVFVFLAATLLYPIVMFWWPWHLGPLDWGPVRSGYLGCVLFTFAAVGVGMMFSSLTESDVVAFFLTTGTFVILYAIGAVAALFHGGALADAVDFISFQSRYRSFARGLIDTRAIVYFFSVALLCLLVSFRSLESRKWS